jgi:hypothetical protein
MSSEEPSETFPAVGSGLPRTPRSPTSKFQFQPAFFLALVLEGCGCRAFFRLPAPNQVKSSSSTIPTSTRFSIRRGHATEQSASQRGRGQDLYRKTTRR